MPWARRNASFPPSSLGCARKAYNPLPAPQEVPTWPKPNNSLSQSIINLALLPESPERSETRRSIFSPFLGTAQGTAGTVQLVVDDARRAKKALDAARISYQETPAESYDLPNKPGALADCLQKLAAKGVNLNSIHATAAKGRKKAVVVYAAEVVTKAAIATA